MSWILLAEDNDDVRESLADALRMEGYEVRTVADGRAALEALAQSPPPGLLVLDLMLPFVTGWAVLRALPAPLPVIVITGADPDAEPLAAPVAVVLPKPVALETVLRFVEQHYPVGSRDDA